VQVLNEPGKTAQSKCYMWLMASFTDKPITVFRYDPSRSQAVPTQWLTAEVNTLIVDGYKGYDSACKDYRIQRLGCWAHARRKFVDAQSYSRKLPLLLTPLTYVM
jgi:transposase